MTLHPPIKMHQSTSYSSLIPPPVIDGPTGAGLVPIIPYKRASKWNSTVNKHHDPFVVNFDTRGMPEGYGVKHGDLTSYSLMIMNTVIVRGSDTVRFPPGKKIQLRIVWPGYESVDFASMIDIQEITVSELAGRVASLYTEYFKMVRQHQCTERGWTFTPEMLGTLRVLGIRNTYDNVYQAEVVVG